MSTEGGTQSDSQDVTSLGIYLAMNQVMKAVGYVQKTGTVTVGRGYSYAGEVDLIRAIRPHMVEQGIVAYPHRIETINQDDFTTSKGANMNRTTIVITYRFNHAPTGSFIDVSVTGEGADVGDKSANKAMTGAYKYALRQAFMIETGDDPDKDPSGGPGSNGQAAVMPTDAMKRKFHALGSKKYGDEWDDKRPVLVKAITKEHTSSLKLDAEQMTKLIDGMEAA